MRPKSRRINRFLNRFFQSPTFLTNFRYFSIFGDFLLIFSSILIATAVIILPVSLCFSYRPDFCTVIPPRLVWKTLYRFVVQQNIGQPGLALQIFVLLCCLATISSVIWRIGDYKWKSFISLLLCVGWAISTMIEIILTVVWSADFFGSPQFFYPRTWLMAIAFCCLNLIVCSIRFVVTFYNFEDAEDTFQMKGKRKFDAINY